MERTLICYLKKCLDTSAGQFIHTLRRKGQSNSCCGPSPPFTCDVILCCPIISGVRYSSTTDKEAETHINQFI